MASHSSTPPCPPLPPRAASQPPPHPWPPGAAPPSAVAPLPPAAPPLSDAEDGVTALDGLSLGPLPGWATLLVAVALVLGLLGTLLCCVRRRQLSRAQQTLAQSNVRRVENLASSNVAVNLQPGAHPSPPIGRIGTFHADSWDAWLARTSLSRMASRRSPAQEEGDWPQQEKSEPPQQAKGTWM